MRAAMTALVAVTLAGCATQKEGSYGVFVDYVVKDAAGNPVAGAPGMMRVFENGDWAESPLAPTDAEGKGQAAMGFDVQPLLPPTEWEIWIARKDSDLTEEARAKRAVRVHYPGDFTAEDRVATATVMNKFWFTKTIVLPESP